MDKKTAELIVRAAEKNECADFLTEDPSQFMHRFSDPVEQEITAFIAANLALGRRTQILSHVEEILAAAGSSPAEWILSGKYEAFFADSDSSFYRMFSHRTMRLLCSGLQNILSQNITPGEKCRQIYMQQKTHPAQILSQFFDADCSIIAHSKTSSCKRLNMFLRWMVRDNSPVDLGLWKWFSKKDLLIPLDTHVMQEAAKLNLLKKTASGNLPSPSWKTAVELTAELAKVFPNDPVKADFALFSMGVQQAQ